MAMFSWLSRKLTLADLGHKHSPFSFQRVLTQFMKFLFLCVTVHKGINQGRTVHYGHTAVTLVVL